MSSVVEEKTDPNEPHWTSEMFALEEYLEPRDYSKMPLIVNPEEAENKYKEPKLLAKIIHYVVMKCKAIEDLFPTLTENVNRLQKQLDELEKKYEEANPYQNDPDDETPILENKISRENWYALPMRSAKKEKRITLPITKIHITYGTNTEKCEYPHKCRDFIREMQDKDLKSGMNDIAYNFLIADDGMLYEGRGWYFKPEVAFVKPECQDKTIDIAFVGKYTKQTLPKELMRGVDQILEYGIYKKLISKTVKMV